MAKAKSETKATGKTKDKDPLGKRQLALVDGVKAIILKGGPVKIRSDQVVYKTDKAYCIFDRTAGHRVAWIPMRRVKNVELGTAAGEAKTKKPRAKRAA